MYFLLVAVSSIAGLVCSADGQICETSNGSVGLSFLVNCDFPSYGCYYKRGETFRQTTIFDAEIDSNSFYVKISRLEPNGSLTTLPIPRVDECETLLAGCPIIAGERIVQSDQRTIPDDFKLGEQSFEFKMVDIETNEDIECHDFTIIVEP